jgi:protoporphyrinogen oxidase
MDWLLLEAGSRAGGRVATETTKEGYRLDAGFQVLLDSYPTARKLIDFSALQPRYFQSGALLAAPGGWERILNPLKHPEGFLSAILSKSFTWSEKISLAMYAGFQLLRPDQSLQRETGYSTLEELERLGLEGGILESFLRPFFGGVFLDNELGTDASVFRYNLKKFTLGNALLPAEGMAKIPEYLASRLPAARQRYGEKVTSIHFQDSVVAGVEVDGGEIISCTQLVLATDEGATRCLLGLPLGEKWIGVSTLYFTGKEPLYEGSLLVLPAGKDRLVRHFTDLTNIAPEYAPPGRRLLSATILNPPTDRSSDLAAMAQAEITRLLPNFKSWEFLKEIRITRALPQRQSGYGKGLLPMRFSKNLFLAGDQIAPVGIESAMLSGQLVAEEILTRGILVRS